jgi:flagellar motor protein MotB
MKYLMNLNEKFYPQKALIIFVLSLALTGCSSIPDNVNPVEWYKGARDIIMVRDEEKQQQLKKISSDKGSLSVGDKSFPKLSSVPESSKVAAQKKRQRVANELVGDNEISRLYSGNLSGQNKGVKNSVPLPPSLAIPLPIPRGAKKNATVVSKKVSNSANINMKKLSEVGRARQLNIPAVNPNSPSMSVIPDLASALGLTETLIVSGNGVQKMGIENQSSGDNYIVSSRVSRGTSFLRNNTANLQRSYQVATILFPNGSSNVGAHDRGVLRDVIMQYKKTGGTLRIIGHASRRTKTNDPIRHKMVNFRVSAARADGVANALIKMGVKASKLVVGSVSDGRPLYFEYMPSGEAGNRRADIFIDF